MATHSEHYENWRCVKFRFGDTLKKRTHLERKQNDIPLSSEHATHQVAEIECQLNSLLE